LLDVCPFVNSVQHLLAAGFEAQVDLMAACAGHPSGDLFIDLIGSCVTKPADVDFALDDSLAEGDNSFADDGKHVVNERDFAHAQFVG
jgi:hypothetical protein